MNIGVIGTGDIGACSPWVQDCRKSANEGKIRLEYDSK